MDIHRCRFVPYPPAAINTIAFSHPRPESKTQINHARVAIGRENGDIEIWNPRKGGWQQEKIIFGGKNRNVDSLAWVTGPDRKVGDAASTVGSMRLFSTGYTSTVTEWDIVEGKPRAHAVGPHGDIWCMTALSASGVGAASQKVTPRIVVGTAAGELALYSVEDDELRFDKIIARSTTTGTKVLSVAFQSPRVVVVGCSDGTVRAYDIIKGMLLRKMTLGADLVGGSGAKEIIVWSVKCLPGGDIVSADSSGQIVIWDGRTYTQAQRIQSHDQDALSLACSQDGNVIVSGGMDRRTIVYKKNAGGSNRWSRVWGRRYHEHDVKTLATFEIGDTSVVLAGGTDATPVLIPLKEAGMENHRRLPMLPHRPPIQSAPSARLIVSWWGQQVHIWTLRKSFNELLDAATPDTKDISKNWVLLKTVQIKGESNITSAAITATGDALIVATTSGLKAFNVSFDTGASIPKPSDLRLSSIVLPEAVAELGAHTVQISPDGLNVAIVQGCDNVFLLDLTLSETGTYSVSPSIHRLKRFTRDLGKAAAVNGLGRYDRSIVYIAFSSDSRVLAAADLAGYIDTWVTKDTVPESASNGDMESDDEDDDDEPVASRWIKNPRGALLPKLAGAPSALSFAPHVPTTNVHAVFSAVAGTAVADAEDYTLVAVTVNFHVTALSVLRGTLTRWSRRNHRSALPAQMLDTRDVVKGIVWDGARAWLFGISFVFMLDLSQDLENPGNAKGKAAAAAVLAAAEESRKRKRSAHDSGAGGKMARGALGPVSIVKQTTGSTEVTEVFEYDLFRRNGAKVAGEELRVEGEESDGEDVETGGAELVKRRAVELAEKKKEREKETEKGKAFGFSFKYRHILGVVPLETREGGVEVALVERPLWEVNLPERYAGANEKVR